MTTLRLLSVGGVSEWDVSNWDEDYWDGTLDNVSSSTVLVASTRVRLESILEPVGASIPLSAIGRFGIDSTLDSVASDIRVKIPLRLWIASQLGDVESAIPITARTIADINQVLDSVSADLALEAKTVIAVASEIDWIAGRIDLEGVYRLQILNGMQDAVIDAQIRAMPRPFGGVAVQGRPVSGSFLATSQASGNPLPTRPL